jgi:hypothetical protein
MARPPKMGLGYFTSDVDMMNDIKIMSLLAKYGPLGFTVWFSIICMIYKEGYFIHYDDRLVLGLIRIIGNKYAKKEAVVQVIWYCAEIGLFDHDLLQQSIITSVGLQKRYATINVRRQFQSGPYWLINDQKDKNSATEKSDSINFNVTQNGVNAAETQVIATETPVNVSNNSTKENKSKVNKNNDKYDEEDKGPYVSDIHLLTTKLLLEGLITKNDLDLYSYDRYLDNKKKEFPMKQLKTVENYVIKHMLKNIDSIGDKLSYFIKAFENGLKEINKPDFDPNKFEANVREIVHCTIESR